MNSCLSSIITFCGLHCAQVRSFVFGVVRHLPQVVKYPLPSDQESRFGRLFSSSHNRYMYFVHVLLTVAVVCDCTTLLYIYVHVAQLLNHKLDLKMSSLDKFLCPEFTCAFYVSLLYSAPYATAAVDDSADDESTATNHAHSARIKTADSSVWSCDSDCPCPVHNHKLRASIHMGRLQQ